MQYYNMQSKTQVNSDCRLFLFICGPIVSRQRFQLTTIFPCRLTNSKSNMWNIGL